MKSIENIKNIMDMFGSCFLKLFLGAIFESTENDTMKTLICF